MAELHVTLTRSSDHSLVLSNAHCFAFASWSLIGTPKASQWSQAVPARHVVRLCLPSSDSLAAPSRKQELLALCYQSLLAALLIVLGFPHPVFLRPYFLTH